MKLAVLGDPVSHSLSPAIHGAALAACNIEGSYVARAVDETGLRQAIVEIRYGSLTGANVTMPHKGAAFATCDDLSGGALRTGAVNTVVGGDGSAVGHNTDIVGIGTAWEWVGLPQDGPVLVLGAGGAAAAALVALEDRELSIAARRRPAAAALIATTRVEAEIVDWDQPISGAVVVNATPLGMKGESLPEAVVGEASALFEMAYGTGSTPAIGAMRTRGLLVAEGTDMLLAQAARSFELWTGLDAPLASMRDGLRAELAKRVAAD